MIVWGYICLDRQCSLIFISQHLEDDILIAKFLAIENKLDVAGHRENVVIAPVLIIQLLKIINQADKLVASP